MLGLSRWSQLRQLSCLYLNESSASFGRARGLGSLCGGRPFGDDCRFFAYYAFQTAWGPFSLSLYKDKTAAQTYRVVLRLYSYGISVLVMLLAVSAPAIFLFFDEAYQPGIILVFPIAFAFALESFAHILQLGISLSKSSHLLIYGYVSELLYQVWKHEFGYCDVFWE